MKKCCLCNKKHNTYIDGLPVCLICFKLVNTKRRYLSRMLYKVNSL